MNSLQSSASNTSLARTQIYLSSAQQAALSAMAKQRGSSSSAVIRQAVDEYIGQHHSTSKTALRMAVAGQWAATNTAPDLRTLRGEEREF